MFQKMLVLMLLFGITACSANSGTIPSPTTPFTPAPNPTIAPPTAILPSATPSATPEPLALRVDGTGISLAEFNNELMRLQDAITSLGKTTTLVEKQNQVLEEFTNQLLLANAASKQGYKLTEEDFQKKLQDLIKQTGGEQSFQNWLQKNHYSQAEFISALKRSMAGAWMRDKIIEEAPKIAEQVHARQILLLDQTTAERYFSQLKAGADFATLAYQADPDLGGDLGWFPRGTLYLPDIEKTAFELEPGKFSPIIKTIYGYHILQVIERKTDRPLAPEARRTLQQNLLKDWLIVQRSKGIVEILVQRQ